MRRYMVSDASVHDSQKLEDVLDPTNTATEVWADSAYRSDEIEEKLAERGLKSRIHRRADRNRNAVRRRRPLTRRARRCAPASSMYSAISRTAWAARSCAPSASFARRCKIGMTNLVYNMRRFVCLERMAAA